VRRLGTALASNDRGRSRPGPLLQAALLLPLLLLCIGPAQAFERAGVRALLAEEIALPPGVEDFRPALQAFYALPGPRLWSRPEQARSLIAALRAAPRDGLDPSFYRTDRLVEQAPALAARDPRRAAEAELAYSVAFLDYAGDLRLGRLRRTASDLDDEERETLDTHGLLAALARGERAAALLQAQAPRHPEYRALRAMLANHRRKADAFGDWLRVPDGPTLRPGDVDPRIVAVRERLVASGDLTIPPTSLVDLYDPALQFAVEGFQRRHGLEVDGLIGRQTLAALNAPLPDRIRQIEVTLERWRQMPRDFGERYVVVNIAGFELRLVEQGAVRLSMDIVVGQPYRSTPVFSDRIRYLELNPDWTVPRRIAVEDKLPDLKQNAQRLADQGFEARRGGEVIPVTEIDWAEYSRDHFPFVLRQRPGPANALGRIKFMFPNRFDVYLHDTPATGLFGRAARAFSSGCIRLSRPLDLAEELLRDQPNWSRAAVEQAIAEGAPQRRINLTTPMPVHLTYATVWRGGDGQPQFRADIYGRDAELLRALEARGGA